MAWMDTFRGLLESDEDAKKRVNSSLRDIYRGFLERAQRLEATAAQAPCEIAETALRKLAADHRRSAELIKATLETRNASAPATIGAVTPSSGVNHWSRIVEDLAVFQKGRDQILDLANDILESHPELTGLFEALNRSASDHVARVRGEIARADPQALN